MWYNEQLLAPYFLNHYGYVDRIKILVDTDTNDDTKKIIKSYPNTEIEDFTFPDMLDDVIKSKKISDAVESMKDCDWVFVLDSDEFIFHKEFMDVKEVLSKKGGHVMNVVLWQIYRHKAESDLDPSQPPILQRRHGDPNTSTGINKFYRKPIVIRPGLGIRLTPGNHNFKAPSKVKVCRGHLVGAHWSMADAEIAIDRRIRGRKERMSKANLKRGHGHHQWKVTEESIRKECDSHLNDPRLF